MPPDADVKVNRAEFNRLHGDAIKSSSALQRWVDDLIEASGRVRHYATTSQPSKQMKNKLAQAGSAGRDSVLLLTVEEVHYEDAVRCLVSGWATSGWDQRPCCVCLVKQTAEGHQIGDIVARRGSVFVDRIQALLCPDVSITRVEGVDDADYAAAGTPTWAPAKSAEELAKQLHLPEWWITRVLRVLRDHKSIVLYGPPGTGKTHIALRLAHFIQPDRADLVRLVQLHPSYGYEQFFDGYRPAPGEESGMRLERVDGPLKSLASELGGNDGVLVLDEMNRGNLPKVFGELYFLLEYRDQQVELLYSKPDEPPFSLPQGLHLIGTMNTSDRSVALVDQALRRRFRFVPLYPDVPPLAPDGMGHSGLLRSFLAEEGLDFEWLPPALDLLNSKLSARDASRDGLIGPSYFLDPALTEAKIEDVWEFAILPAIEDQLGATVVDLDEFGLERIRRALG